MIKDGKYYMDGAFKDARKNEMWDLDVWRNAIDRAEKAGKINVSNNEGMKIYAVHGSKLHIQYLKALREVRKQTIQYKLYKVKQAFRILVKLCFRQWFKIRL